MKAKLSLKTLYRSPVRMILTFILLVAVTFTLFSQVLEHAVTVREIDKAAEQYDGVGAVEVSPAVVEFNGNYHAGNSEYAHLDERVGEPDDWFDTAGSPLQYEFLTSEQINDISSLPYITSVDMRYMTAGVSKDYIRLDDGDLQYNYTTQCIAEGTLGNCTILYDGGMTKFYQLTFIDCRLISGVMEIETAGTIRMLARDAGNGAVSDVYGRALNCTHEGSKYNNTEFIENLDVGTKYAFVARYESNATNIDKVQYHYALSDCIIETWSDTFWYIDGETDNWIELEEYTDAKAVSDIILLNHHTFDIVYTDDMSSIMRFANGSMSIVEGRSIDSKDSLTNPNICVVSREFAKEYNLTVGDTISMNLGDKLFEQYASLGAVPLTPERVSENYTEVELEIVGIYADLDGAKDRLKEPNWIYSYNAIFVPSALLNVSEEELENHKFSPSEVSFKIGDAWDIDAFYREVAPQITQENMGLTLIFEDQGWSEIEDDFVASKNLGIIRIGVLSAAVLVATWFVAMLYITGRRKDYAIMRVLGTDKRRANKTMLLPFMFLMCVSVFVSAVVSCVYTGKVIKKSNSMVVLANFETDKTLPLWIIIICIISVILLAFVIAFLMLSRLGKKAPLELIQNNQNKKEKKKAKIDDAPMRVQINDSVVIGNLIKQSKYTRQFTWKYVFRHIRRTPAKAILTILVAVLLLNVNGQLNIMRHNYAQLIDSTVIKSNFVGGFQLNGIEKLENSGYVKDVYYYSSETMDVDGRETQLVITNNPARYCGQVSIEITYGNEHNSERLDERKIIVSDTTAELYQISCGDMVVVAPTDYLERLVDSYLKAHREKYPQDERDDAEIVMLYIDEINTAYENNSEEFIVIGTFSVYSEDSNVDLANTMFSPGTTDNNSVYGRDTVLEMVEATVADNNLVDEYREFGQELAGGSVTEGVMFVMDTSKLENLRNTLRLVEMLYPIAVVVTLVIGAFLCGLIIVQTSKDIAIMRVLGTSKAKTRTILVLEQMILCVIGIIISGVVLYIRGALMQMLWVFGVYALVILLASIVASTAASRKNVLELLQTKE